MTEWVILKHERDGSFSSYGPVAAPTAAEAVEQLAEGDTQYLATKRGRYVAVELGFWQEMTFDYTRRRGVEQVAWYRRGSDIVRPS